MLLNSEVGRAMEHDPQGAAVVKEVHAPVTPPIVIFTLDPSEEHCRRSLESETVYNKLTTLSSMYTLLDFTTSLIVAALG